MAFKFAELVSVLHRMTWKEVAVFIVVTILTQLASLAFLMLWLFRLIV